MVAHLAQFVLHAGPDAAQVDGVDAVEVLGRLVGGVARGDLDAGVVERHVEPAERVDRALDEGGDLVLVGDVAGDGERPMTGGGQLVGGGAKRLLVGVGEDDGGAGAGEGLGGGKAHAGAGAGDDGDLAVEVVGRVHVSPSGRGSPWRASRWIARRLDRAGAVQVQPPPLVLLPGPRAVSAGVDAIDARVRPVGVVGTRQRIADVAGSGCRVRGIFTTGLVRASMTCLLSARATDTRWRPSTT